MLSYIAKRILLFIPTLLLVSILAFGLSRLADTDVTATLLSLQGVEPDMHGYRQLYEQAYNKAGLHKPTFYFSLRPNYEKHNINAVADPVARGFILTYANDRYSTDLPVEILDILYEKVASGVLTDAEVRTWLIKRDVSAAISKLEEVGEQDKKLVELVQYSNRYLHKVHFPTLTWNGLDNQYHCWLANMVIGSFGTSTVDGQAAASKIWSALRWTLLLLVCNIVLTLALSVPYGLYTGLHLESRFDRWSGGMLFAVFSMPTFWVATLLVMLFTTSDYGMKIFPGVGIWYQSGDTSFLQMIANKWTVLILPLVIIVVKDLAYLGRMIRDTVAGEAQKLYATTARAKGVSAGTLAYRHILPNALGPAITLAVGAIPGAFGGVLLIEIIFNIPGMGRLLYSSIANSDWQVVYPIVLLTAVVTICCYLVGDVLYAYLNPKINL